MLVTRQLMEPSVRKKL